LSLLNDPEAVRLEYADESRLAARGAAWRDAAGPDPRGMAFAAVAEAQPTRVLEVGCGCGELAERIVREVGADLVAVDQSERMVALTRARGVDAIVGDVQDLPFADETFDCVLAAWMLYHVPDVDQGLAEIARVLRSGGRLVAVTNSRRHYHELKELMHVEVRTVFDAEEAEEILLRYFASVERRDAFGHAVFEADAAVAYIRASHAIFGDDSVPQFDGPIRVTRGTVVFVAEKA
jgi:SAM-dependent methyltransferase